jgi:replicative DNA helicase
MRLLKLIVEDEKFSEQILDIIIPEYFDSILTKIILKYILEYCNKYNAVPSYDTIQSLILEKESDAILKEKLVDMLKVLMEWNVTDKQYVKDVSVDFCRKQSLKRGLLEAAESWEKGDYEMIQKIITDSLKLGDMKDTGHNYISDVEKRLVRQYRKPVPCMNQLDQIIGGGLSGGELGVVLSPTGGGKSMMLVRFATTAFQLGKSVVYYSLELSERSIGNRFDACICNINLRNILDYPDAIRDKIEEIRSLGGRLIIKEFPTGTATVNTIRNHLNILKRDGFEADEIFIDYADIMKASAAYVEKRHALTHIYESLRALSMELDIPIWTASQAGRQAINSARFDLSVISESLGKAQTADVIIGLARTDENKREMKASMIVLKNRNGSDGYDIPLTFDTSRVQIEVDEASYKQYVGFDNLKEQGRAAEEQVKSIVGQISEGLDDLE